jgi:chorismate synthase
MVALVLADAVLEKFGGDSISELKRNFAAYLTQLEQRQSRIAAAAAAHRES